MKQENEKIDFKYNLSEYWKILKKYKGLMISLLITSLIVESLFVVDKFF